MCENVPQMIRGCQLPEPRNALQRDGSFQDCRDLFIPIDRVFDTMMHLHRNRVRSDSWCEMMRRIDERASVPKVIQRLGQSWRLL
jgi:hypothetical protein